MNKQTIYDGFGKSALFRRDGIFAYEEVDFPEMLKSRAKKTFYESFNLESIKVLQ